MIFDIVLPVKIGKLKGENGKRKNEREEVRMNYQMSKLAKKGIGYRKGKTAALLKELLSLS